MITTQWIAQQFYGLSGLAPLAEGGQKWVFRAKHVTDGDVVLKLIKPNQNAERVRREVLAVQQVQSSRVPRVVETGIVAAPIGDCFWLREQRIVGQSVRQVVTAGPMKAREVMRLGLHVLEALADVERARIVHRDVKPDNVMRGRDGGFWLLDFGIARHLDLASLTQTAALAGPGTLGYAPPEQFRNRKRDVDVRADLFALGVTLIECLTGRHPFREGARDGLEVLRRVETVPVVVPRIPGDTGDKVRDMISAMTQRRLDCRPASAAEALAWMRDARVSSDP